jgi:hypothetical protein
MIELRAPFYPNAAAGICTAAASASVTSAATPAAWTLPFAAMCLFPKQCMLFFQREPQAALLMGCHLFPCPVSPRACSPPPYRPRCQQHPMHAPLHSPATGTHSSSPYHRHIHPCCITLLMQPLHHNQRVGDRQPPCAPRNVRGVDHDQGGPRVRQLVLPLGD